MKQVKLKDVIRDVDLFLITFKYYYVEAELKVLYINAHRASVVENIILIITIVVSKQYLRYRQWFTLYRLWFTRYII